MGGVPKCMATCHPDKFVHAWGLCNRCYQRAHKRPVNKRRAVCHPDRPFASKGLCKPCYMQQYLAEYVRPKESMDRRRSGAWASRGIKLTVAEYESLLAAQEGRCAICREFKKLAVDHDHETGKVRGLLCDYCNRRLLTERHTVELLQRAITYLRAGESPVLQIVRNTPADQDAEPI